MILHRCQAQRCKEKYRPVGITALGRDIPEEALDLIAQVFHCVLDRAGSSKHNFRRGACGDRRIGKFAEHGDDAAGFSRRVRNIVRDFTGGLALLLPGK